MIKIKVSNQEVIVPTEWCELTLEQRFALNNTNIMEGVLNALKLNTEANISTSDMDRMVEALSFLNVEESYEYSQPTSVIFDNEVILVSEFDDLPIGMYKDIQLMFSQINDDNQKDIIASIISIYVYYRLNNKHDYGKSLELKEKVYDMNYYDCIDLYTFFLSKLNVLKIGTTKTAKQMSTRKRSLWQVLMSWKDSVFSMYYRVCAKVLTALEGNSWRTTL